jgi:hypothetical protein
MHTDAEDLAAWREFVASEANLTRAQILRFEDILEQNRDMCEWAVRLLGLSGTELIDRYGCRGTDGDREQALAFLADADDCQRRLAALSDLVRAAGLRVRLALCERDACPSLLATACGNLPN